jgi:hypothetical protein
LHGFLVELVGVGEGDFAVGILEEVAGYVGGRGEIDVVRTEDGVIVVGRGRGVAFFWKSARNGELGLLTGDVW